MTPAKALEMETDGPSELRRCGACGRHLQRDAFKSSSAKLCLECEARAARAAAPPRRVRRQRNGSRRRRARHSIRKAPSERLQARVDAGSATWHQCDGTDVHPKHVDAHREGFWTEGHRVIGFIEGYCVFPEGAREGEPAELMPWWREVILEGYRLAEDGLRQYRRWFLSVAKKNAKTTVAGWLGLYHVAADTEPSPKVVCAAANDDQADLVFTAAKDTAAERSQGARDVAETGVSLWSLTEAWEDEILVPNRPGASLKRVASGGGNLDGPNLYVRIIDELHEWRTQKHRDTYRVLLQGGTQREAPLFIQITTAGFDQQSICFRVYEHGKLVADDPTIDPYLFAVVFEAPPNCELTEENWKLANPGAGHAVSWRRFLEDYQDPEMTEADARRYRFNQWTETEEAWLPERDGRVRPWSSWAMPAKAPPCRPSTPDGEVRVIAMIDASTRRDSTVIEHWEISGPRDRPRVRSWARVWERDTLADGSPDENWRLPQQAVKSHLYALHNGTAAADEFWCEDGACACGCGLETPPLQLVEVGVDPARITMQTDVWLADGIPVVEVYQSDARMVPGFQTFYELLDDDRFAHDGGPAIERHIANSVVKWASNGGRRIDRKHASNRDSRRPNDGAITKAIGGYTLSTLPEPEGVSIYEERGVLDLGEIDLEDELEGDDSDDDERE